MQKSLDLQHKIPDSKQPGIIVIDFWIRECERIMKCLDLLHHKTQRLLHLPPNAKNSLSTPQRMGPDNKCLYWVLDKYQLVVHIEQW